LVKRPFGMTDELCAALFLCARKPALGLGLVKEEVPPLARSETGQSGELYLYGSLAGYVSVFLSSVRPSAEHTGIVGRALGHSCYEGTCGQVSRIPGHSAFAGQRRPGYPGGGPNLVPASPYRRCGWILIEPPGCSCTLRNLQNKLAARMSAFDHLVCLADFMERENGGDFWLDLPATNQGGNLGQYLSDGR